MIHPIWQCTQFLKCPFSEDLSVLSEDVASLMSPDDDLWLPQTSNIQDTEYGQELISKGPPKAEVQLR